MNPIPCIPENAPFTPEQRLWLNGYLAGLFSSAAGSGAITASANGATPAAAKRPLVILYGSQTGSAEGLAKKTAKLAEPRGFTPRVLSLESHSTLDFATVEDLLVITSTYGDGEPPDNAQAFWSWLSSETAPRLEKTRFAVLALGDTNYPQFCEFGKRCDARLEELGAVRLAPRVDCDVEYDELAKAWTESVFTALTALAGSATPAALPAPALVEAEPAPTGYSRKRPFPSTLLRNELLTRDGSLKEVRHIELSLEGSGLAYEVGDALGVLPSNCPRNVDDLLQALGFDGEEAVPISDGAETSLRLALLEHYDICKPSQDLLRTAAERAPQGVFASVGSAAETIKTWLWGREVIDVAADLRGALSPAEFVALLRKLQPRLYSISSSPKAHPGEVHLTVGIVRYDTHGRSRGGVCSTYLADRCASRGGKAAVFVQPSHGFKLPEDLTRPVIMIGPGTGIAPFRAFLEERAAVGASGKNWLFFGDQRRATDYLYETTLEAWRASGHLARLDLAFSRDQAEKVYVQHRMLAAADELWRWLESGAHLYVCGDASRMAKDVDAALHQVCQTAGGLTADSAAEYVSALKSARRYQRDVY